MSTGATDREVQEAIEPEPESEPDDDGAKKQPKKSRRILNLLKSTAKGGIQTVLTADKAKAAAGGKPCEEPSGCRQEP